jgi:hypothetical protein
MPPEESEPIIPASELPMAYNIDRAVTWIVLIIYYT